MSLDQVRISRTCILFQEDDKKEAFLEGKYLREQDSMTRTKIVYCCQVVVFLLKSIANFSGLIKG